MWELDVPRSLRLYARSEQKSDSSLRGKEIIEVTAITHMTMTHEAFRDVNGCAIILQESVISLSCAVKYNQLLIIYFYNEKPHWQHGFYQT